MTNCRNKYRAILFSIVVGTVLVSPGVVRAQDASDESERADRRHNMMYFRADAPGRGYVGIQLLNLTPELRSHFGVSDETGVMVSKVEPGSPAEQAGVQVGDILTEIDGNPIDSTWSLSRYVRGKKQGESVTMELWRDGSAQTVFVSIDERERDAVFLGNPGMGVPPPPGVRVFEKGGPFIWDGQDFTIHLDGEWETALGDALGNLEEHFNDADWQDRLKRIQSMDWEGLSERMEELESRLKALEQDVSAEEKK